MSAPLGPLGVFRECVKTAGEAIEHCGTTVLNEELQLSLVLR